MINLFLDELLTPTGQTGPLSARAQSLIGIMQPAAPEVIAAVFGDDVDSALAVLGVVPS